MANLTSLDRTSKDGYAQYYADRLWGLLPGIYRSLDVGPSGGSPGPLRELVNRIGAQAAVVRRSIDRMGENQSIETCDDWVIPYIGDLLATRLVSCLDASAQRIDVAKTIYYRRRAGTVGLLEELAADISTRDARVVEFFRRMGRTRHQFDPPIATWGRTDFAADLRLSVAENLKGAYSGTPAGGFADLRNAYGASNTGSAFDEYAYTADLRTGGETTGWYNISHLGVFVWWLYAFAINEAIPVSNGAASPCFTFDPTGRDVPLYAPSQRAAEKTSASWGENWISPEEWELPVPIRETLWKTVPDELYPNAFWVGLEAGGTSEPVDPATVTIHPEVGRFSFVGGVPGGVITTNYSFGFASRIGAGGFDADVLTTVAEPANPVAVSGALAMLPATPASVLEGALTGTLADTTVEITDSYTYHNITAGIDVAGGSTVVVRAASGQRPVLRWNGAAQAEWTANGQPNPGTGTPTVLVLQGMHVQSADVVLTGNFDTVYLRMMTLDPGTSGVAPEFFGTAIDGLALRPSVLWIEGEVTNLVLERCITGPIRTRNGGAVETLTATDCIMQSIATHAPGMVLFDAADLAANLKSGADPLAVSLVAANTGLKTALVGYTIGLAPSTVLEAEMTVALATLDGADAEAAWPLALADLALGFSEGLVSLSRCTVMGPTYTHRLSASECVFDDVAAVEDAQHGCVRFCAYAEGSTLHQPYRSVQTEAGSPLFETRLFGKPDYARLRSDADNCILIPAKGGTMLEGAQNGAEMGAFCLEMIALLRRGLSLKYEEYMPIGQLPVWIDSAE